MTDMKVISHSVEQTRAVGARVAARARAGDVYGLVGDLGAGKTEFVRGFVAHLDPAAQVRSPSFALLNIYQTPRFPIYHFDLFRLRNPGELTQIGFDEYSESGEGICLIEWADLFSAALPAPTRLIRFHDDEGGRRVIESDAIK